jgi:hypothetical protein
MEDKPPIEPSRSPAPGIIPERVRVHDDAIEGNQPFDATPDAGGPDAERERRRAARKERRGPPAERPGVMIPTRRKRLPLEAPLMRLVATAGIVGINVAVAAIMTSQHSQGWLIGLVVSIVSLALAAVLWSSRRL